MQNLADDGKYEINVFKCCHEFKLIRRINLKTRAIELEFINSEQMEKNEHARG